MKKILLINSLGLIAAIAALFDAIELYIANIVSPSTTLINLYFLMVNLNPSIDIIGFISLLTWVPLMIFNLKKLPHKSKILNLIIAFIFFIFIMIATVLNLLDLLAR